MKLLFTVAWVMTMHTCFSQEPEQRVNSRTSHVTVFLEGAQITRLADVSLKKGVTVLNLPHLASDLQGQSIQVEAPSNIKILSVSHRINFLDEIKKPEQIATLKKEQDRLKDLITLERSMQEVYREEESILKTNKSIGGQNGLAVKDLMTAMDYFRQRLTDIRQQLFKADQNVKAYEMSLSRIEAQLAVLQVARHEPTAEIIIKVSSPENTNDSPFKIKYVVAKARWFPTYDIRAKDVSSPVSITYKANISQKTGEDWTNVILTVSSGNPSESGAMPIIKPWYVDFNNGMANRYRSAGAAATMQGRVITSNGTPVPGVNVLIKGTTVGTVTDGDGNYSIPLTADAETLVFSFIGYNSQEIPVNASGEANIQLEEDTNELNEVIVTAYGVENALKGAVAGVAITRDKPRLKRSIVATPVIRQTDVEFTLDESFTVKSDGEVRTTDMVEYELDALYEYYCVPKLDQDAFLTARILDWDDYNFLEGEANLFFEGKYIGKSILDTRTTSDTLNFSLGRDGNVVVKREKKKEFSSRQFIGASQKSTFAYNISVRNKKRQPINIVIVDQIPVSGNKDVIVDKIEDSRASYTQEDGLMKWKKTIPPGGTEEIVMKYSVRYPKSNTIMLE